MFGCLCAKKVRKTRRAKVEVAAWQGGSGGLVGLSAGPAKAQVECSSHTNSGRGSAMFHVKHCPSWLRHIINGRAVMLDYERPFWAVSWKYT